MTIATDLPRYAPGEPIALEDIPLVDFESFRETLLQGVASGGRVTSFFGQPDGTDSVRLTAILAYKQTGNLSVFATQVGDTYPSLTPDCPQVHWFEREIAEQWGVVPERHPWFKPIRFHASYRPGHDAWSRARGGHDPAQRYRFFPSGRPGDSRSCGRADPCRSHRARPFPLPVSRRDRLSSRDLPRLSASGRRAGLLAGPE